MGYLGIVVPTIWPNGYGGNISLGTGRSATFTMDYSESSASTTNRIPDRGYITSVTVTITAWIYQLPTSTFQVTLRDGNSNTIATKNFTQPANTDSARTVTFSNLKMSLDKKRFYIVVKQITSGNGYISTLKADVYDEFVDLDMSVSPSTVMAGSEVGISFTNRMTDTVALSFKSNNIELYKKNISADSVSVICPRSWFTTSGQASSNTIRVDVTGVIGSDTASGAFTLQAYSLSVTSPSNLMIGDTFAAKVNGATANDTFTATFRYGDIVLHQGTLVNGEISVVCPKEWFILAGVSGNNPLKVDVDIVDQDGKTLTATFYLNAPKLIINRDKASVVTRDTVNFTITNRDDEELAFKLMYNGKTVEDMGSLAADTASVYCDTDWFDRMDVVTSKTMIITAYVEDSIKRTGTCTFTVNAGPEMEPVLEQPVAHLVQPEIASAFPEIYIAGYSKTKISAVVNRPTKAKIVSAVLSYSGTKIAMEYNDTAGRYEATTPVPLEHDTVFTVTIRDERGFTKTATVAVNDVYQYIPPSFTVDLLYRSDAEGFESAGGTFYRIRANCVYDMTLPGNTLTKFTACVVGGEEHDIESGETYIFPSGFDYGKRITVRVAIRDKLSSEITAEWVLIGGVSIIHAYNELVDKYKPFNESLQKIDEQIVGFPALMKAYYNTIDMELFLRSGLMPTVSVSSTTAAREAAKLTSSSLSPAAVTNLSSCSATTAASAILGKARCLVRSGYQIKVKESAYNQTSHRWTGSFTVINYADEDDRADTGTISITLNADMERYIRQKIDAAMKKESNDVTDITELFKLGSESFANELKKYSLQRLTAFREACQACMDIIIQTGASSVSKITNLVKYNTKAQSGSSAVVYRPGTNVTIRGVSCTIDNNGVITLNGTATEDFQFYLADEMDGYTLSRGYYTYSLGTTQPGVDAIFSELKKVRNNYGTYDSVLHYSVYRSDDYESGPFRVPVEGADEIKNGEKYTGQIVYGFSVDEGASFSNYTIRPMLEAGIIPHAWLSPTIGTGGGNTNLSQNDLLYYNIYQPYTMKLELIDKEIKVREHELEIVVGEYDGEGNLTADGAQTIIEKEKEMIQEALNFEAYLGTDLWEEFASYRREDELSNPNYISDGLNNAELFLSAEEYVRVAQCEIYKAAEAQHSIEGDLHNLLTMEEFKPLTDRFCIGNWIRVGVDEKVYKLRLYNYEIDFDNMGFAVEFTNVQKGMDTASDVSDLLGKVRSMSVSYGSVARQATSGKKSKDTLDDWSENGISVPIKIVSGGSQEFALDQNGLSGKEYDNDTEFYSPAQLKFSANGLYATTDAWLTGKTVVGMYTFTDPVTGQKTEGFGSIAELLVGKMLLNDAGAVISDDGSIVIDKSGIKTNAMTVTGNLIVRGTKNRVAQTADYGDRLMYSYETAAPLFGDVGEGELDEDGICRVTLDPIFAETISTSVYQVFLQRYGDGDCYVDERSGGFFVVRGTPGLRFGWEIKASQSGYENTRLEAVDE